MRLTLLATAALLALSSPAIAQDAPKRATEQDASKRATPTEVLAASPAGDWRVPVPENTFYMDLPGGRVVIELAPAFAPVHVENMRKLARENWYEGTFIVRVQDNYVTQWGMPDETPKPMKTALDKLAPEFTIKDGVRTLPFAKLPDPDAYAPEVGISDIFPAARDPKTGEAWMTHCYGIVGVGRGMPLDSGSGAELYTVIGHSPRPLDKVITLVGRVLKGMELLTALPRGTGTLGFYEKVEQRVPITAVRLAADVPEAEREKIEVLSGQSETYTKWRDARRFRQDDFFIRASGHIDVCNAMPPVRVVKG